ncbi:hypothetical protein SDC9_09188 [bioreactor metagenome]|uniref:Uncharacterized protein n=1 Tax=bioreactor metagenome TaxID=1076179 RepID=A0A644T9F8_9ZZZZ|nr:hypothetical protein [Negativicutes bacterium]
MTTIIKQKLHSYHFSDSDIETILTIYDHDRVWANIKHAERAMIDRKRKITDASIFVNKAIIQNWALHN